MNRALFSQKLAFLGGEANVGAELYFHYNDGEINELLKAPTDVAKLNKKLATLYSTHILETFKQESAFDVLSIKQVREYDVKNTYYYYQTIFPEGLKIIEADSQTEFSFSAHKYSNIKGYVIKLILGADIVTIYKVRNNIDFHVKKTVLTILRIEDIFTSPSDETLTINEKFDYLLIGNVLLVMDLDQLERKFHFEERIKIRSEKIIKDLKENAKNIVENFDKLQSFLGKNLNFAKKMDDIDYQSALWKTPFSKVKQAIENREDLKKYLKLNATGNKFKIDSDKAAKLFLSLCNDLVVESILSGKVATVSEKENVESETSP